MTPTVRFLFTVVGSAAYLGAWPFFVGAGSRLSSPTPAAGFWQLLADRPKHQAAPSMTAPITTEECRRKAQKCIAESARAHANFNVSADWLY
jgi:hypothetical protein